MINLDHYTETIKEFLQTSMVRFQSENGEPNSIGIYCCPWAGWLTTNFNVDKTLRETENNCPDFEFVEYDGLELEGWQDEYESDEPMYVVGGRTMKHDHDSGDEELNGLVFRYLEPIAISVKAQFGIDVELQMLDSNYVKVY